MRLLDLSRLWWACILATLGLLLGSLAGCGPGFIFTDLRPISVDQPPVSGSPETPAEPQPADSPTYTYVGQQSPPHDPSLEPRALSAPEKPPLTRRSRVDTTTGEIPDLHIRLGGNSIEEVMSHYGYVPAIKSRDRLLGKIVGDTFAPLSSTELSGFAARGRAGDDFPDAGAWTARIARELGIPESELQCIFLVPKRTEQLFIQAEQQALKRGGVSAGEVALVRAHFDRDLSIIVDELVRRDGQVIAIDSVRVAF